MNHADRAGASGFSLVEAVIAAGLVTVATLSGIGLVMMTRRANLGATTAGIVSILSAQKMEQLRSLAWGYDSAGLPIADTTSEVAVVPLQGDGGPGLSASPPGTLKQNTEHYCDFVDERGRWIGGGTTPPPGTVYVRRWEIAPLPSDPDTLLIQVLAFRWRNFRTGSAEIAGQNARRLPDEARLITLKTRKTL
jgi:hypothetical protein